MAAMGDRLRGFFTSGRRPLAPPRKALILQPCCLAQVMLTTPLLAALGRAFPEARFDWAISDWALPAVGANRRVTRTIRTGPGDLSANSRDEMQSLIETIRGEAYDTCFIPTRSGEAARLARQAGIPQRVGLEATGRRAGLTLTAQPPPGERQTARIYLSLAAAVGVDEAILHAAEMEFQPPDGDRTTITRWLVEEFDWLGDTPLVVLHPGGGDNPAHTNLNKRWPAQRFARLANHLMRVHGARLVVVGTAEERALAAEVTGMMSIRAANRAGKVGLGQLGALCELASLYVGNEAGATYVAAATGCPTLVIYGPTDPGVSAPYMVNGRVTTLWRPISGAFDWANGVSLDEAAAAADELLAAHSATNGALPSIVPSLAS